MRKNLYFRTVLRRNNMFKQAFQNGLLKLASYPRLMLEVFIRKNFGERYFTFSSVLTISVLMGLLPLVLDWIAIRLNPLSYYEVTLMGVRRINSFWGDYALWYIFLLAFLVFSLQRWQEVKRNAPLFDFSRFSLYSGDIHPFFREFKISGKTQSIRTIETLLEPAGFFIAGVILYLTGQKTGILLIGTSLLYSLSYWAAYRDGDNFIKDKNDERIMNEQLANAFVEDMDADKARGVRFHMTRPAERDLREKLSDYFFDDSDENPVTTAH